MKALFLAEEWSEIQKTWRHFDEKVVGFGVNLQIDFLYPDGRLYIPGADEIIRNFFSNGKIYGRSIC